MGENDEKIFKFTAITLPTFSKLLHQLLAHNLLTKYNRDCVQGDGHQQSLSFGRGLDRVLGRKKMIKNKLNSKISFGKCNITFVFGFNRQQHVLCVVVRGGGGVSSWCGKNLFCFTITHYTCTFIVCVTVALHSGHCFNSFLEQCSHIHTCAHGNSKILFCLSKQITHNIESCDKQ